MIPSPLIDLVDCRVDLGPQRLNIISQIEIDTFHIIRDPENDLGRAFKSFAQISMSSNNDS